eukprot:1158978-Pelagomonas_calceolata.AAC.1
MAQGCIKPAHYLLLLSVKGMILFALTSQSKCLAQCARGTYGCDLFEALSTHEQAWQLVRGGELAFIAGNALS